MDSISINGSCLCGVVRYSASGEPWRFYQCYCSRCRKATGSSQASNLFLKGSLSWLAGEDGISTYKLPQAERFANSFCRNCGSRVPRFIAQVGMVFIPAGSLDDEPGLAVQAGIFSGSRASWSCTSAALPEFDQYPPP